jgi:DNA invertase Pin-like site-specific DNA recombinase
MILVVSYARISADQERDEHGIQHRHKVNRQTSERLGWIVVEEFTDNDKSAAKSSVVRDDSEAMLGALRAGKLSDGRAIRGIVVMAEDRLVRRPGDDERFVEAITYRDGRVYADQRGPKDLYSEDVESMGLISAVISKMEIRKMQRRMRQDHHRRALAGEPPAGGKRPFGWKEGRRTIDQEEARHVRQAAEQFVTGRGLNSIVAGWQREGLKTTTSKEWTATSLKVMLQNPRLCGWRMLNSELVRGATVSRLLVSGTPSSLPSSGWRSTRSSPHAEGALSGRTGLRARYFPTTSASTGTCSPAFSCAGVSRRTVRYAVQASG